MYEYQVFSNVARDALQAYLNKKGEQGWRLIAVCDGQYFLEREKISILHESQQTSNVHRPVQ